MAPILAAPILLIRPQHKTPGAHKSMLCPRMGLCLLLVLPIFLFLGLYIANTTTRGRRRRSNGTTSKERQAVRISSHRTCATRRDEVESADELLETKELICEYTAEGFGSNEASDGAEAVIRQEADDTKDAPTQQTADGEAMMISWHGVNQLNTSWGWMA